LQAQLQQAQAQALQAQQDLQDKIVAQRGEIARLQQQLANEQQQLQQAQTQLAQQAVKSPQARRKADDLELQLQKLQRTLQARQAELDAKEAENVALRQSTIELQQEVAGVDAINVRLQKAEDASKDEAKRLSELEKQKHGKELQQVMEEKEEVKRELATLRQAQTETEKKLKKAGENFENLQRISLEEGQRLERSLRAEQQTASDLNALNGQLMSKIEDMIRQQAEGKPSPARPSPAKTAIKEEPVVRITPLKPKQEPESAQLLPNILVKSPPKPKSSQVSPFPAPPASSPKIAFPPVAPAPAGINLDENRQVLENYFTSSPKNSFQTRHITVEQIEQYCRNNVIEVKKSGKTVKFSKVGQGSITTQELIDLIDPPVQPVPGEGRIMRSDLGAEKKMFEQQIRNLYDLVRQQNSAKRLIGILEVKNIFQRGKQLSDHDFEEKQKQIKSEIPEHQLDDDIVRFYSNTQATRRQIFQDINAMVSDLKLQPISSVVAWSKASDDIENLGDFGTTNEDRFGSIVDKFNVHHEKIKGTGKGFSRRVMKAHGIHAGLEHIKAQHGAKAHMKIYREVKKRLKAGTLVL